jgi:anaerobic magnesium-protoporphyrin IX monomethyl ester cyclase
MRNKVILIYPPSSLSEEFSQLEEVGNYQQPLGLAYLAAVLEKEEYQVKIIDAPPLGYSLEKVMDEILSFKPDYIGISAVTPTYYKAKLLAERLKEVISTVIIIGGPHVTALPEETLGNKCFDIGVVGEGEMTFLELLKVLENGDEKKLEEVRGIVFRRGDKVIKTAPRSFIADLDKLPFPARHLMPPLSLYHPTPATFRKRPIGTLMSSRGCPFRCTFCCRAIFGSSCRFRQPKKVADELEILVRKFGAKEIRIWDDTFNADPGRTIAICEEIIRRNLNVSWTCLARVNFAFPDVLAAMKKAGCWQISYGVESGNNEILKNIKKGITVEMVAEAIKATKKAGISSLGFFILGLPGETEETMRQTINFAKSLPLDAANFTICTPFPGTEIYQMMKKQWAVDEIKYDKLMVNLPEKIYYVPKGLSAETVKRYERLAYREFYLRPKFIWRQLRQIKSFSELWPKIKAYFTIRRVKITP